MKSSKLKLVVLIFLLLNLFPLYGQEKTDGTERRQHIVIMFDISKSLLLHSAIKDVHIQKWDRLLTDILFGKPEHEKYSDFRFIYPEDAPMVDFPLLKKNSILSFYKFGTKITKIIDKEVITSSFDFTNRLPQRRRDFTDDSTDIYAAELKYLQLVDSSPDNILWILISDNIPSIPTTQVEDLTPLKNKYHEVQSFIAQLQGNIKVVVWRIKDELGSCLKVNNNSQLSKPLTFIADSMGKNFNIQGEGLEITPQEGYSSSLIKNFDLWLKLYDSTYTFIKEMQLRNKSVPFIINKIKADQFNPALVIGKDTDKELNYIITARYNYNGILKYEDLTTSGFGKIKFLTFSSIVEPVSSKNYWWIFLFLILTTGLILLYVYGFKNKGIEFTIEKMSGRNERRPETNYYTKKFVAGTEIKFGKTEIPNARDIIFSLNAPEFSIKINEDKTFTLFNKTDIEKQLKSGDLFTIKNKDGNNIDLKIYLGKPSKYTKVNIKKSFKPGSLNSTRR